MSDEATGSDPPVTEQQKPSEQASSVDATQLPLPIFTPPVEGEVITSAGTNNSYRIGKQIGAGNFGIVFECTDTWDNELAVKILKPSGTYDAIRDNAISEYQKLMLLRHPYITYVYEAFEYRHTFYIVCERCWRPLNDLIQDEKFVGSVWVRSIARCVLQALHFLHINNFAHQDIHGGNVFVSFVKDEMISTDNAITFKLGDFGICKLASEMDANNTVLADWMRAPESLNPNEFGQMDCRMDIYHTGLLFLQLLIGKRLSLTKEQVLAGEPRRMALDLGPPYSFALEKALRRHVDYRTASAMEFWRDLNTPSPDV